MSNCTSRLHRATFAIVAIFSIAALTATATPIFLGTTDGNPANVDAAFSKLVGQITLYNASNDPDLPEAIFEGNFNVTSVGGDMQTFSLDVTGWQYLVFKAGPSFYHYYVGADTGSVQFSARNGLSNYKFFNAKSPPPAVPEGATTATLLGLGLLGVTRLRGRIRQAK